ncbi:MAG: hypothetical protein M9920_14430 [Verrucomicrobiae bacterium]|nr:hypothetical protein [Verrucomicrobiae bacterium]
MNRATFIIGFSALLALVGVVTGCGHNPLKPRAWVNRGSCLQFARVGIIAVREYAKAHGHLPEAGANLAELGEFSVLREVAVRLNYGGSDALSLESPERIIVLKCIFPVSSQKGGSEFYYCALLSGEVLLLQDKDAILGGVCPQGIGEVVFQKE